MAQGRIKFGIDFNVNKAGLNDLTAQIKKISDLADINIKTGKSSSEMKALKQDLQELEKILQKSYNIRLNSIDITKLNQNIQQSSFNMQDFQQKCQKAGAEGIAAFRNLNQVMSSTKSVARETHVLVDKMKDTFANTVRWTVASSAINSITGSIQKAWNFTKELDASLNDIMVVTDKNASQMENFARQANKAAKALGTTTKDYTTASLIYYQQGLSDQDVQARTETTIKAANVTGQSTSAVSEQLTAVWNGYKVNSQEAELYVDKLSAVAATTAADLEELSTGMSKVASAANIMGVDIDQLNGQLATVISVTRQAPESVGTAFKTIYARMGDIEAGLDTETTLGEYTSQMAKMGFNVLAANGKLRDMGEVIEEIGNKWNTLSREQQVALSQAMAGTRQYNNLLALFDNWDMYTKSLDTSAKAAGTLSKQNEIVLESLDAKINALTASTEKFYMTLVDNDSFKFLIESFTSLIDILGEFSDSLGGGATLLLAFGQIASKTLNSTIGNWTKATLSNTARNREIKSSQEEEKISLKDRISVDQTAKTKAQGRITELESYLYDKEGHAKTFEQIDSIVNAKGEVISRGDAGFEDAIRNRKKELFELRKEVIELDRDIKIAEKNLYLNENRAFMSEEEEAIFKKEIDLLNESYNEQNALEEKKLEQEEEYFQESIELRKKFNKEQKDLDTKLQNERSKVKNSKAYKEGSKADRAKIDKDLLKEEQEKKQSLAEKQKKEKEDSQKVRDKQKKEMKKEQDAAAIAQQNIEQDLDLHEKKQQYEAMGEAVGNVTSGILGLAGAISALANLPDIWDDEDASTGEKVLKTITVIVPAMIMLGSSIKSLNLGIAGIKANGKEAIFALFGIGTGGAAAGAGAETGAAGIKSFTASLMSSPLLPFIAILLGIVAAITAVSFAVDAATKAYNKDNIAAEEAAENAEELAEAYKNVKTEYEALKQSIEEYHGAQDAIDKLIAGTEEWRDAITDANTQVMELVQTYPELAKYLSNQGGRLTISEEGLEAAEKSKENQVDTSYRLSLISQTKATEAELKARRTSFTRNVGLTADVGTGKETVQAAVDKDVAKDLVAIALKEGNENMFASESAFLKILEGTDFASFTDKLWKHRETLQDLVDATREANEVNTALNHEIARSKLSETTIYNSLMEDLGKLELPNRDDFASFKDYNKALVEYNQSKTNLESQMSNAETYFASNKYNEELRKSIAIDEIGLKTEKSSISTLEKDDKEALIKEYWSYKLGIPAEDITVKSSGGANYTIKYTKDGEAEKQTGLSYSDLKENLLDKRVSESVISEEGIEDFQKKFNKEFGEIGSAINTAFSTFIGDAVGDFSALTKEEFQEISNTWKNIDVDQITNANVNEDWYKELKAKAEALGLETTNEGLKKLLEGIQNGIENYTNQETHIQDLFLNRGGETEDVLGADAAEAFNTLSQASQTAIAQLWNDMALASAGGAKVATDVLSKLNTKNIDTFQAALNVVDWSNFESIEKFSSIMQETTGATAAAMEDFAFNMRYAKGLIEEFNIDKAAEDFVAWGDILKAISSEEKRITTEQYNSLSSDMQEYFIRMADGTYQLIGAAEEFKKVAEDARRAQLLKQLDEFRKKREADYSGITDAEKSKIDIKLSNEAQSIRDKANNSTIAAIADSYTMVNEKSEEDNVITAIDFIANSGVPWADPKSINDKLTNWRNEAAGLGGLSAASAKALSKLVADTRFHMENMAASKESSSSKNTAYREYEEEKFASLGIDPNNVELSADEENLVTQYLSESASMVQLEAALEDLEFMYGNSEFWDNIQKKANLYRSALETAARDFKIEVDPFDQVDKALTKINNKMQKLQQLSSLLTGEELVENLKKQNDLLNESISTTREKLNLTQQEAKEKRFEIENLLWDAQIDFSDVNYDEDGNITNWAGLMDRATSYWQTNYNKEEAIAYEKKIKDAYDEYSDYVSNKLPQLEQDISDTILEQLNNNVEIFELEIQIKIDKAEAQKSFIDFKKSFVEENAFDIHTNLLIEDFESGLSMLQTYQEAIDKANSKITISDEEWEEINKHVGEEMSYRSWILSGGSDRYGQFLKWVDTGDNDPEAYNSGEARGRLALRTNERWTEEDKKNEIKKLTNALLEEGINLLEVQQSIEENYLNYQEAVNTAYERQIELIDSANQALDHQKSLIELMYGDKATKELKNYYASQAQNAQAILDQRKAQYAQDKADFEAMNDSRDLYSQKQQEALTSQYIASTNAYLEAVNTTLSARREQFLNESAIALEEFDEKITGIGSEKAKEQWDWMQAEADDYLNSLDAAFGIEQMITSYNKAANSTTDIRVQQKINDLREQELKILREKDKLSQHDLDRAQKQLDVLQARIALEDAQQNKSQMRLMRGANGTYSYQYVADQNAIDEAREKLNKAQQELIDLDEEQLKSNTEKIYDIYAEMMEKIAGLTDEAEINAVVEQYASRLESLGMGMNDLMDNIRASVNMASSDLGLGDNINAIFPWLDSAWMQTVMKASEEGWGNIFDETVQSILSSLEDYTEAQSSLLGPTNDENGDIFVADFDSIVSTFISDVNDMTEVQATTISNLENMSNNMKILAEDTLPALREITEKYREEIEKTIQANSSAKELPTSFTFTLGEGTNAQSWTIQALQTVANAATGMYTGEWGPEGKLAVLHEKELVLNKQDTENILSAVDLVRSLGNSMMNTIAFMSSGYATSEAAWELAKEWIIEQTVNINAEFPATDRAEIEAAFEELIGLATQHAYENKRG